MIVEDAVEHQREFQADVFAVETNQFQELLATQIAAVSRARTCVRSSPGRSSATTSRSVSNGA